MMVAALDRHGNALAIGAATGFTLVVLADVVIVGAWLIAALCVLGLFYLIFRRYVLLLLAHRVLGWRRVPRPTVLAWLRQVPFWLGLFAVVALSIWQGWTDASERARTTIVGLLP